MPEPELDDNVLMLRLSAGDEAALRLLVTRWQRPLMGFVFRYIQNRETAEDIVQETFIRLYRARDRFNPNHRFASWLFKIAANLCKNHQRWLRRHPSEPLEDGRTSGTLRWLAPALPDRSTPDRIAEAHDTAKYVATIVGTLPHAQRVALLLHYYESLNYSEIARILGCSERGVETSLYRARKSLAKRFLPRDAANFECFASTRNTTATPPV